MKLSITTLIVHLQAVVVGATLVAPRQVTGFTLPPAPPGFPKERNFVLLRRQSDDTADPAYNRDLSPPIAESQRKVRVNSSLYVMAQPRRRPALRRRGLSSV